MSERTIYRHLNGLTQHGFIELLPQERKSRNGRFSIARIRLTQKALQSLELTETHSNHRLTLFSPTAQLPRRLRQSLPDDLKWLTTQGLSKPAIFKLMGLASKKNKRLSAITAATRHTLSKRQGNDLYAYLIRLIDGPNDFSLAAKQQHQRCQAQEQQRRQAKQEPAFKERFARVSFINQEQTRLYKLDEPVAGYLSVFEKSAPKMPRVSPLNLAWLSFLKTGLGQGQLILATKTMEAKWPSLLPRIQSTAPSEKYAQPQVLKTVLQEVVHNGQNDRVSDGYTLSNPTNSIKNKTVRHRKSVQVDLNDSKTFDPIAHCLPDF